VSQIQSQIQSLSQSLSQSLVIQSVGYHHHQASQNYHHQASQNQIRSHQVQTASWLLGMFRSTLRETTLEVLLPDLWYSTLTVLL
jgi:hypothetical protein